MMFPVHLKRALRRVLTACVRISVEYAVALLILLALGTGASLYYTVTHLGINTDTAGMLDPDLPFQRASRAFAQAFPQLSDQIVVIVEGPHAGDTEAVADRLSQVLTQHRDIIESVYQPAGGAYFATHGLLYLDTDTLWALDERLEAAAPLLGPLAGDPSLRGLLGVMDTAFSQQLDSDQQRTLQRMFDQIGDALERRLAGNIEPIRWRDQLFQDTSDAAKPQRSFILIKPKLDYDSLKPADAVLELLHRQAAGIAATGGAIRIRVTGSAAMDSEELVTVSRDAVLTTGLSFALVCVLLIWGLRAPGPVFAVLVALACGLVWTAAFATLAVGSLNLISVSFAVLFIGMGVDFGIQFAMRYLEESDRSVAQPVALNHAATGVGGALTLASVGAAISFLSFVPTDYRGLAELGVISAFSMLVALLANLTILPALLSLMPVPAKRQRAFHLPSNGKTSYVFRHRHSILFISIAAIVASLYLLPRARFDFNPINLKDPTTESVAAFRDLASDPDSSPYVIQVLAPDIGAATRLADELGKLKVVDKTVTLTSYVPRDQDEKLQIIADLRAALPEIAEPGVSQPAPATAELAASVETFSARLGAADLTALEPGLAASGARLRQALAKLKAAPGWPETVLPAVQTQLLGDLAVTLQRLGQLLQAGPVSLQDLPADLRMRYVAADGRTRIEVYPKANLDSNQALSDFVRNVQRLAPDATDSPVELLEASDTVIHACIQASLFALALTLIMHVIVLHGWVDAILVAVPLVLAMIFTVATSVVFDIPFNFANIIALPLLIGLNNAYGAYLVVRRHAVAHLEELLHSSTPRAVFLSGMTSISSFGVLAISTHPGMAGMGILISLSLSYALLCALLVLPAVMAVLETRGGSGASSA